MSLHSVMKAFKVLLAVEGFWILDFGLLRYAACWSSRRLAGVLCSDRLGEQIHHCKHLLSKCRRIDGSLAKVRQKLPWWVR